MTVSRQYLLASILAVVTQVLLAQEFTTYTYLSTDSVDMELDLFLPTSSSEEGMPLVIYVHGGGFAGGNRTEGHALATTLTANNIACASISYTLMQKGRGFGCDIPTPEKINAIRVAAAQTWEATDFLLQKAVDLKLDPSQVFLAGSSAGAETILHAAFWDREKMKLTEHGLPGDFQYAGVIPGAGAIMDLNLIREENALPLFAFHGDKDNLVPYATASHHYCSPESPGWLMLFGSRSIADHLTNLGQSVQLHSFAGGGHGHAGEYFRDNQNQVVDFIQSVMAGLTFTVYETRPGK
ncbi:MAG: alpha/beta hydrolase [Bacteroidota bacterium]